MPRAALWWKRAVRPRAAKPHGGALRPNPAAGRRVRWGGRRTGPVSPRHLPAQRRGRTQGQNQGGDPQAASQALDLAPDIFSVRVLLEETGERFLVTNCRGDMTVRELKVQLELIAGIPLNLQRLQYLDQGVLMDDTTLKFHDVVPGGMISLCVWHYDGWTDLVLAAVEEDTSKLSCLGVAEDSLYRTAHARHLGQRQWKRWTAQRAFVALYVASHRGHVDAVRFLLEHGASCHGQTPAGRTPLHAAAAMNQVDCINLLLQRGASASAKDALGVSPKAIARQLNYRQAEQRMALSHWMAKAGTKSPVDVKPNKAPQRGKPRSGSRNKT